MNLTIQVKLNEPRTKITKTSETTYDVSLTEPPEKNRANRQLINLLAKELHVLPTSIVITNPRSKTKNVKIRNNSFK